jgi:serine/threonine protein kinase/formylglycine-generating enzyme required for sulfatase activity
MTIFEGFIGFPRRFERCSERADGRGGQAGETRSPPPRPAGSRKPGVNRFCIAQAGVLRSREASSRGLAPGTPAAVARNMTIEGTPWAPPARFDEFALLAPIGRGAMGQVFLGRDLLLDRPVAIKFVTAAGSAASRARFLTEARAIARLQHPNVVTIHRVGETDGRLYIVGEMVRGRTLDRIARPMHWHQLVGIALDLARGLAAAHAAGVLHRDIKPSNAIRGDDGVTKLLDFGLAKLEPAGEPSRRRLAAGSLPGVRVELCATLPGSQTADGAVVGTPLYLAPESWRGEPASPASDLYALGALLFELLTGRPPHEAATPFALASLAVERDAPTVRSVAPEVPPALAGLVDRCLAREATDRMPSAELLCAELERIAARARPQAAPRGNPYRGLHAFEAEHRALFFGRDGEADAILERLREGGLVLVAGDSGAGKSSLCRAAVLPAALEGRLSGHRHWTIAAMVPGRRPLTALDHAIGAATGEERSPVAPIAESLVARCRHLAAAQRGLLLFIDQLEELITLSDPAEAAALAQLIGRLGATPLPGLRILATVRGDFLTRVAALSSAERVLSRSLFLLSPLDEHGMREAITGPARLHGVSFEQGTVDRLVASADSLPLLQFTLAELWDRRDAGSSTIESAALNSIGGVEGALARHADQVLASLLPVQRPIAREILSALVSSAGTRARRPAAELTGERADRREVLEALVRGRLLVAEDTEGEPTLALVHEALLTGWALLRRWLEEEAAERARRARLGAAAAEWERLGRPGDLLLTGAQLAELGTVDAGRLDPRERDLVAASRRALRRARRGRRLLASLVAAAVLATYGAVKLQAARDTGARVAMRLDQVRALLASARSEDHRVLELRAAAFAAFDSGDDREGERRWRDSRALASGVDPRLVRATALLDEALAVDPQRADLRALLADAILDRILIAEREHRSDLEAELVTRLAQIDADGSVRGRLSAPARLVVEVAPASAHLQLERYRDDGGGRLAPVPVTTANGGRLDLALPPGSYRLLASAEGRADVRFPLLLARGEVARVSLPLPAAAAVPAGFVWVPAGRFLYGSAADDELRRIFLTAAPQHVRETGAYAIARRETTFRDWIQFLEALPARERAARMPRPGDWGVVSLTRLGPGRYLLRIGSGVSALTAASGELLRYPGRERRAEQDWLDFPVSGIAPEDAAAFTAWLDRTGRVSGARLCSEVEWERAATGADGRRYPHGDRLEADDANHLATYGEDAGPDAVSSHPASRSPFELDDMTGNVYELTRAAAGGRIVARGGAFGHDALVGQATNRVVVQPGFRGLYAGMRVCATPPAATGAAPSEPAAAR